jgi:CRISPR system Cascade subunit CasA
LCQLGALALYRADEGGVAHDAERWRAMLRGLTAEWPDDAPWRLVVEDLTRPAFMQPPVPEKTLAEFTGEADTPDDLDVLVTSKNHGVKQAATADGSPASWITALVTLQTTAVYYGNGNWGICRMRPISQFKDGSARPFIGLAPEGGQGARWRRDVTVMLSRRDWFFARGPHFRDKGGRTLLWCLAWDGTSPLELDLLDPWFIECCRRVRLVFTPDGELLARKKTTKAARVETSALKGNVGDPWIPIDKEHGSVAFDAMPTYRVMADVLFKRGKWITPLLLEWHPGVDQVPTTARFVVLVRGQGTTDGLYERAVRFEGQAFDLFLTDAGKDRLAELSQAMIENVGTVRNIVRSALLALLQGAPIRNGQLQIDHRDQTTGRWADEFWEGADREVDGVFFDRLFARAADEGSGRLAWFRFLEDLAWRTFERAVDAAPLPRARAARAVAVAENLLGGRFYAPDGGFAELREEQRVSDDAIT